MAGTYRSREERKQSTNNKKKQDNRAGAFIKKLFLLLLTLGIIGMIVGAVSFFILIKDAPPLDETLLKDPLSSKVYDMDGNKIAELGQEKRTYVSYDEIPKIVEDAVIATEDARFYDHYGIDLKRIGGAFIANITDGFGAEGASTITQQVVKLSFLSPEKTIKRKVQELWLAFQLEQKYRKEQILEIYLNKIYYSKGAYGIATAAEVYFGKELNDLNLEEAALLAGIPQSPNNYNPFKYPEEAENRRNIVLSLMVMHGKISEEEANAAKKIPVESSLVAASSESESTPLQSFLDQVLEEVTELGEIDVYSDGLEIYTTLDPNAQAYVEKLLETDDEIHYPNDDFQAGIALIDTQTGEIRALGGGRKQTDTNRINFAIDIKKQPGSTIKPILDYGPAIEYLQWSTYYQLVDEPYSYSGGNPINNWDNDYEGQMSIRTALARSRNIPALKALQSVGLDNARNFAVSLGLPLEEQIFESYSIGGLREGVSPLDMAGAYRAFGNNGTYNKPFAVRKVVFTDDTEMNLSLEPKTVMKDYTAFMITDMLKSVLQPGGTGYPVASIPGLHVAGKTGTTNYDEDTRITYDIPQGAVPDSWFAGYTTNYTAAIWTGYRDRTKGYMLSRDETQIAKQLFNKIISYVSQNKTNNDFPVPNSVVIVGVEKESNPAKLPSEYTPDDEIVYEYFVKGTEPTEISDKYKKMEQPSDVQIMYDEEKDKISISWIYPEEEVEGTTFELQQSIDEGPYEVLATTKEMTYELENPIPGAIYSFKIIAFNDADKENRSEPAITTIEVPVKEESEDKEEGEIKEEPGDTNDSRRSNR